jgi:hypothetical protein
VERIRMEILEQDTLGSVRAARSLFTRTAITERIANRSGFLHLSVAQKSAPRWEPRSPGCRACFQACGAPNDKTDAARAAIGIVNHVVAVHELIPFSWRIIAVDVIGISFSTSLATQSRPSTPFLDSQRLHPQVAAKCLVADLPES